MRPVLALAVLLLSGGLLYLYYGKLVPLEKVVRDLHEENLRLIKRLPAGGKGEIKVEQEKTVIKIPSDSIFMPGSTEISPQGKKVLQDLLKDIKKSGFNLLEVAVYTDKSPVKTNRDRYPTNWELAAVRATSIVRFLISKGLSPEKLVAVSYGDSRARGTSSADRFVEFRVY